MAWLRHTAWMRSWRFERGCTTTSTSSRESTDWIHAVSIRQIRTTHTLLHTARALCVPDDDGSVRLSNPVIDVLVNGLQNDVE